MRGNAEKSSKIRKNSKGGHKRRNERFPGLKQALHPRTRWEYLDQDYISQLSDEEKAFLSKFNDEYYGATLESSEKPWRWKKDFHKSKKLRKDCTDRNNCRNRDLYTRSRTQGWVEPIEESVSTIEASQDVNKDRVEDAVIKLIDMKKGLKSPALDKSDSQPTDSTKDKPKNNT